MVDVGVTIDEFITMNQCQVLYHMSEKGSWASIQKNGLLSTTALLDLFEKTGPERVRIESQLRRRSVPIYNPDNPGLGRAVIRDQDPMIDRPLDGIYLKGLLEDDTNSQEWFGLLNRKTFFWVKERHLRNMLCARNYRNRPHWVIKVDTRALLQRYADRVTLSNQNTGSLYSRRLRGRSTFVPFRGYPPRYDIVELAVEYDVPDIADLTISVTECVGVWENNETVCREGKKIWPT